MYNVTFVDHFSNAMLTTNYIQWFEFSTWHLHTVMLNSGICCGCSVFTSINSLHSLLMHCILKSRKL